MFENLKQTSVSPADCIGLYKLFFEWILSSDQLNLVKHGHEQLMLLGRRRPDIFREFISPNVLIDVFTNSMHSNKPDLVILVGEILDLLDLKEDVGEQQTEDEKALSMVYCNTTDNTLSKVRENEDLKRSITNVARYFT